MAAARATWSGCGCCETCPPPTHSRARSPEPCHFSVFGDRRLQSPNPRAACTQSLSKCDTSCPGAAFINANMYNFDTACSGLPFALATARLASPICFQMARSNSMINCAREGCTTRLHRPNKQTSKQASNQASRSITPQMMDFRLNFQWGPASMSPEWMSSPAKPIGDSFEERVTLGAL